MNNSKPVIAHLIYRFDIGGLERVMVNCINAMQNEGYQHIVIALTEVSDFAKHLNDSVKVYQLDKKSGKDLKSHWRLLKLLRKIKPDLLHTYNLATIEYHPISRLAGVKAHIHAEHGRDNSDPQGLNKKHNLLRQLISPFVDYFVPVSTDLHQWLDVTVGVSNKKNVLIRNGINIDEFHHLRNHQEDNEHQVRFIHVARLDPVKNQVGLLKAFAILVQRKKLTVNDIYLTVVGDGNEMQALIVLAEGLGISSLIEFTGARSNIAELLSNSDVFVLSSIAEGIPMTVLEAMASSLPVISTNVGGLAELVTDDETGYLVEKQNAEALSSAMEKYINNSKLIKLHGRSARSYIFKHFSEQKMVSEYLRLYQELLGKS
ncbi:hypothetical protein CMT41_18240 [Colwellia sp. MT41]|uniref:TIGR03088 family PEP-CTERM/XrtA system glycosyltransferase n=1 Tax=Colwellia sp. MT41 TaxID=58049 RepID=UPI000717A167|nr:TIGR03088 family PEP-CTERM/XrtA system glycosyltransferase [Colwellia sp. MT41]ALO36465.1 hypothetical protein CMT41_18240 [Colwellia sp. MT41]